jgi:3-dehydro-L-gulonate 2-dehydrogenase
MAFERAGMPGEKAEICAQIHTESSRDGIYSHGLNRVPRFVEYIHKGWVDVYAEPEIEKQLGSIEIYNGKLGPGILNARFAMDRATELASENTLGLVALHNTTHWMRGGSYGWQAAEKGFMAICWTNTESCMPAWGAKSIGIGNNPLVIAVPHKSGHIVFDMAMSQYSYGKLQVTRLKNERLPFPGGFDHEGKLTDIPGPIEETMRILPTGYWKGSGLAFMLDIFSAILSNGLSTPGIDKAGYGSCGSCNQVFIAFDPLQFGTPDFADNIVEETIRQIKLSELAAGFSEVNYPGERTLQTRRDNLDNGIPVDDTIWETVKELAKK